MKIRNRRLLYYFLMMLSCGLGLYLILDVFQTNIMFFVTPTEFLKEKKKFQQQPIRLGGVVRKNSIVKVGNHQISFHLTDFVQDIPIQYRGLIPSLFREGKGAVVKGRWHEENQVFQAEEILAKHDETYEPPQIEKILKKND